MANFPTQNPDRLRHQSRQQRGNCQVFTTCPRRGDPSGTNCVVPAPSKCIINTQVGVILSHSLRGDSCLWPFRQHQAQATIPTPRVKNYSPHHRGDTNSETIQWRIRYAFFFDACGSGRCSMLWCGSSVRVSRLFILFSISFISFALLLHVMHAASEIGSAEKHHAEQQQAQLSFCMRSIIPSPMIPKMKPSAKSMYSWRLDLSILVLCPALRRTAAARRRHTNKHK